MVWNPKAGSSDTAKGLKERLSERADLDQIDLTPDLDLIAFVHEASQRGVEVFIAAGGDGTVNALGSALVKSKSNARMGIIPLGTGNDLARSLLIPLESEAAWDLIEKWKSNEKTIEQSLDVLLCKPSVGQEFHVFNMISGGLSTKISVENKGASKKFWGPLSYIVRAASAVFSGKRFWMHLRTENANIRLRGANVIIANGRFCGGGTEVAPCASFNDGYMDVIVIKDFTTFDLLRLSAQLVAGEHLEDEKVLYFRSKSLTLSSVPKFLLSTDGETDFKTPLSVQILPNRLQVIAVSPESSL